MVLSKKTKTQLSIAENRERISPRKSVKPIDHWAFLDEIEAPMWIDLNLEVSFGYKDKDEDWFQSSHQFHQCSSRQLISVFSHAGEGNANKDFEPPGPSSPRLPTSVSKSRGKHYRSRVWGRSNCGVTLSNQHPVKTLSSKSSQVNLITDQKTKPKPSNGNQKGNARSKASSFCESSLTETAGTYHPKPSPNVGDSKSGSSAVTIKDVEDKSASTITSERSEQQHQKLLEVSSQMVCHTSGLLSALKVTLRKSCVTRQASRVGIVGRQSEGPKSSSAKSSVGTVGRQSQGRKSSLGKSSVGSSSHPWYDVKSTALSISRNKDITPDSRNVTRVPQATLDRVKVAKESTVKTQDLTSKSRGGSKTTVAAKSANFETAKLKVNQVVHSKALKLQNRANEQDSVATATKVDAKVRVSKQKRLGDGKENVMSQRPNTRAAGTVQVQKMSKQVAQQKCDRKGLMAPKGTVSGRSEGKGLTNFTQKLHFR